MKKICIIGPGKMGTAMAKALKNDYEVQLCGETDTPQNQEIIILAVKPQNIDSIQHDLSGRLVISIMAGVSLQRLSKFSERCVRSMPNLALQIQEGFTAWIASSSVSDKETLKDIFSHFGEAIEVQNESQLDSITALCGSGPAYFFYITELISEKAREFGFSEENAQLIAEQTFTGAANLLKQSPMTAKELREAVTSKGGTTAAALQKLADQNLSSIFKSAIETAKQRSKELNS